MSTGNVSDGGKPVGEQGEQAVKRPLVSLLLKLLGSPMFEAVLTALAAAVVDRLTKRPTGGAAPKVVLWLAALLSSVAACSASPMVSAESTPCEGQCENYLAIPIPPPPVELVEQVQAGQQPLTAGECVGATKVPRRKWVLFPRLRAKIKARRSASWLPWSS